MGQAFDESGNVLGEATGASEREVLDKLKAEFDQAFEFRIRKAAPVASDQGDGAGNTVEQPSDEKEGAPV